MNGAPQENRISEATKRQHTDRIISYGKKRAMALAKYAEIKGVWGHVDWDRVRAAFKEARNV